MKGRLLRLRNRSIMFIGNYPTLFFGVVGLRQRIARDRGLVTVTRETDLVIEGFLRSANSFATRAFLSAQPRKVKVANRTHVPATVIRAAQWGIPTLILIREPKDVVLSYMLKKPFITASGGFKEYINYYRRIGPYRDHFVIASFGEVTTDFGAVIARINYRFDTNFALFSHQDEAVRDVFSVIERNDRAQVGDDAGKLSVPLPERQRMKERLRSVIEDDGLRPLVAEAEAIYQEFSAPVTAALVGGRNAS